MTTDLFFLVCSALLAPLMPLVYAFGRVGNPAGMKWTFGNRDLELEVPAWSGRARRAHANLIENLPTFAVLVLVAHVTDRTSEVTALGAAIFFFARLVYAVVYTAGIPYVRTVVWFASLVGEALILLELFLE